MSTVILLALLGSVRGRTEASLVERGSPIPEDSQLKYYRRDSDYYV